MELKYAVEIVEQLKKFIYPEPQDDKSRIIEAVETVLSFCESALKFQSEGMPKKKDMTCFTNYEIYETDEDIEEYGYDKGFNSCHDEWTAWLVGRVNKENIDKIVNEVLRNRILQITDEKQIYTGYPQQLIDELSDAIVKDILGEGLNAKD